MTQATPFCSRAADPLIVGACFVGRHVSVLRALQSCGLSEAAAAELVEAARRAGVHEVRFERAGSPDGGPACTVIVRRMSGNHAEVWERPSRASPVGGQPEHP